MVVSYPMRSLTDSIFRHVPARAALLYARSVVPLGGHTQFADMRAAWDALPQATHRRIDGLVVEHSIFHSHAKLGFTDYSDTERATVSDIGNTCELMDQRAATSTG
jgi:alpha-ketoglutarate-dependent 2,4-dichlorophenoxyacetate dioxygenase